MHVRPVEAYELLQTVHILHMLNYSSHRLRPQDWKLLT